MPTIELEDMARAAQSSVAPEEMTRRAFKMLGAEKIDHVFVNFWEWSSSHDEFRDVEAEFFRTEYDARTDAAESPKHSSMGGGEYGYTLKLYADGGCRWLDLNPPQ